jgi:hypothetical protein
MRQLCRYPRFQQIKKSANFPRWISAWGLKSPNSSSFRMYRTTNLWGYRYPVDGGHLTTMHDAAVKAPRPFNNSTSYHPTQPSYRHRQGLSAHNALPHPQQRLDRSTCHQPSYRHRQGSRTTRFLSNRNKSTLIARDCARHALSNSHRQRTSCLHFTALSPRAEPYCTHHRQYHRVTPHAYT